MLDLFNVTKNTTLEVEKQILSTDKYDIPVDKLFKLIVPGGITSEGQKEILLTAGLSWMSFDQADDYFGWEWKTTRGTLPKRIASYVYKIHHKKLSPEQISQIGNIAIAHSNKPQVIYYQFVPITSNLRLWSGDMFCDYSSCYYGDRNNVMTLFRDDGNFYGVVFFKEGPPLTETAPKNDPPLYCFTNTDINLIPLGRCWIYSSYEFLIAFNGYGREGHNTTLPYARYLALAFESFYKKISLLNQKTASGLLYINNGTGFYITDDIKKHTEITSYDFSIDTSPYEERSRVETFVCDCCENSDYAEDRVRATAYNGDINHPYPTDICSSCYEEFYYTCEHCDGVFAVGSEHNPMTTLHDNPGLQYYMCNVCAQRLGWLDSYSGNYYSWTYFHPFCTHNGMTTLAVTANRICEDKNIDNIEFSTDPKDKILALKLAIETACEPQKPFAFYTIWGLNSPCYEYLAYFIHLGPYKMKQKLADITNSLKYSENKYNETANRLYGNGKKLPETHKYFQRLFQPEELLSLCV